MQIETRWRNMDPIEGLEPLIARNAERLKRVVGRFDPERGGVELAVHIEHLPKRERYDVSGSLHLTNHSRLFAREESHDVQVAIGTMFDELNRQVRKLKARYDTAKRSGPATEDQANRMADALAESEDEPTEPPSSAASASDGAGSSRLDREQLGRLARMIRRELRFQTAMHDFDDESIDPVTVMDETVAAAIPRLDEMDGDADTEIILIQEAMAAVHRRIQGLLERSGGSEISTSESAGSPDKRDRLESATDRHLAPFFEESLRFGDLLPVDGAAPDEVAQTLEMEDTLDRILSKFPAVVRRVFLLSTLENLSLDQVARALNINEDAARTHLDEAREGLRVGLDEDLSPSWRRLLALEATRPGLAP